METRKAHPALFGGKVRGKNNEEQLFQSTIDIHIQITHKNANNAGKRLISNGSPGLITTIKVKCRTNTIDRI